MTAAALDAHFFPEDRSFVSQETYEAFVSVVTRLEAVVEAETGALAAQNLRQLGELTRQKRLGLYELNRVMKAMDRTIPSQDILSRLTAFRAKLADNDKALSVHLRAIQHVNALIVQVMRDSESDGTYSRGQWRAAYDDA